MGLGGEGDGFGVWSLGECRVGGFSMMVWGLGFRGV